METGAVVVAAGMSSRMGDFKPMLSVGTISIAQRVLATLHQAGVNRIVVVTGFRADELERHLARSGAVFLRNENYRLILEKRYLCFMTWEQISLDMHYTNRWLRKMHERALDVVDRILLERSGCP